MVESASMRRTEAALSREKWAALILGMTGLFGLTTRIYPALLTGFPLNDGGMFLVMIRDLRLNGFVLPAFTSYNFSNIPFAYPPLGFYIAGLLGALGLPDLELLRWLPILFNLLCIPAFFLLARTLLKDLPRAAAATLIYALVPDSFAWQIMGGGLTRALGMLCLLLAQYHVLQMFQKKGWRNVWLAALFSSMAVLSHPEVALAAASSCTLLWLFFGRNGTGSLKAALVAASTLLLTAPWWGSVLALNGSIPFKSVIYSGQYSLNLFRILAGQLFTFDLWTGLFHLLVLGGLIWNLYKRKPLLPVWLVLPYLVEPRSAPAYAYIPAALMASQVLMETLPALSAVVRLRESRMPVEARPVEPNGIRILLLLLGLLWFIQGGMYGFVMRNSSLRPPEPQRAMSWAAGNTPAGSTFIILTGNGDPMTDPIQEWFPALAERTSRTTLQGQEWVLGKEFFPRRDQLRMLQACNDTTCLENWSIRSGLDFNHLLLQREPGTERLLNSLSRDSRFKLIHEAGDYLIFERQP